MYRFLLRPRWLLGHLAVLAVVAVCLLAASWQWSRHEQRRALNELLASRQALPPVTLEEALADGADDAAHRRVRVEGTYDTEREVLLRGRQNAGRPGYHVLTPLRLEGGGAVVVNRGWVPIAADDPPVAEAAPPAGDVRVEGVLRPTQPKGRFGPTDPPEGALEVVSRVDLARLARQLPYEVAPVFVELVAQEPPQPGALPIPPDPPALDAGPHLGYVGQWTLFALVAVGGYIAIIRRAARDDDERREPPQESSSTYASR